MEATKSLKRERYLFWILVGGLLFLRFPWIILGKALAPAYGAGIVVVFEVGTYLLTALLVFLERKRLAEYHIDSLALVLLLGAPVVILIGSKTGGYALPGQGIKALFASVLLIALLIWRPVLPKRGAAQTAIYLGAAVLIGGALAIVSGFLLSFQVQKPLDLSRFPSAGRLLYEGPSISWTMPLRRRNPCSAASCGEDCGGATGRIIGSGCSRRFCSRWAMSTMWGSIISPPFLWYRWLHWSLASLPGRPEALAPA